jgi:hypothetical protein
MAITADRPNYLSLWQRVKSLVSLATNLESATEEFEAAHEGYIPIDCLPVDLHEAYRIALTELDKATKDDLIDDICQAAGMSRPAPRALNGGGRTYGAFAASHRDWRFEHGPDGPNVWAELLLYLCEIRYEIEMRIGYYRLDCWQNTIKTFHMAPISMADGFQTALRRIEKEDGFIAALYEPGLADLDELPPLMPFADVQRMQYESIEVGEAIAGGRTPRPFDPSAGERQSELTSTAAAATAIDQEEEPSFLAEFAAAEVTADAEIESPAPSLRVHTESEPPTDEVYSPLKYSLDFRFVRWQGQDFTFTATQAACVKILWENWRAGIASTSNATLLAAIESNSARLRDVFKTSGKQHPAWRTLIRQKGKGQYALDLPSPAKAPLGERFSQKIS